MDNFQKNICYNKLFDQCGSLCSELVKQECKFSFCLKLEHFQFSLSSEKHVPARGTRKRPPSYMRRQNRRREDLLKRRSEHPSPPPAKEDAVGDDKNGRKQAEGGLLDQKVPSPLQTTGEEIDSNVSLDLAPHLARGIVENSDVSEREDEYEDEEAFDNDNHDSADDKATGREANLGSDRVDGEEWREVSYRGRKASPDPVTTRKIPKLGSYAKPLLTDLRFSWVTEDRGVGPWDGPRDYRTVFYPPEIPLEKVKRAIGLMDDPFDWSVLRPTAPNYYKWVYFPPQGK